jgi:hypothetical protein
MLYGGERRKRGRREEEISRQDLIAGWIDDR